MKLAVSMIGFEPGKHFNGHILAVTVHLSVFPGYLISMTITLDVRHQLLSLENVILSKDQTSNPWFTIPLPIKLIKHGMSEGC